MRLIKLQLLSIVFSCVLLTSVCFAERYDGVALECVNVKIEADEPNLPADPVILQLLVNQTFDRFAAKPFDALMVISFMAKEQPQQDKNESPLLTTTWSGKITGKKPASESIDFNFQASGNTLQGKTESLLLEWIEDARAGDTDVHFKSEVISDSFHGRWKKNDVHLKCHVDYCVGGRCQDSVGVHNSK